MVYADDSAAAIGKLQRFNATTSDGASSSISWGLLPVYSVNISGVEETRARFHPNETAYVYGSGR